MLSGEEIAPEADRKDQYQQAHVLGDGHARAPDRRFVFAEHLDQESRDRVEQKDVIDGEMQYSQYAWDSILVENSSTIPDLDLVLVEFVGESSVLSEPIVRQRISSSGSNCRNQPRYPILQWGMMNLEYAGTGRIA